MKCPICARPLEQSRCETCKKTFRITLGNERGCPQCGKKQFPSVDTIKAPGGGTFRFSQNVWECSICNLRWTEE